MDLPERVIDAERAGGTGNATPKAMPDVPPMSVEGALAYREYHRWRKFRSGSLLAVDALADELARFRAALPDVIACPHGDGTTCTRDNYGWSMCCSTRLRMTRAGLISAPVREVESGDGA